MPACRLSPSHSVESVDTVPVSFPGCLTVTEMLANIKDTMISKCRPVRKVQPPSDNMCLVGQSSGRIKWIQPSGSPRFQALGVGAALCLSVVSCLLVTSTGISGDAALAAAT